MSMMKRARLWIEDYDKMKRGEESVIVGDPILSLATVLEIVQEETIKEVVAILDHQIGKAHLYKDKETWRCALRLSKARVKALLISESDVAARASSLEDDDDVGLVRDLYDEHGLPRVGRAPRPPRR